MTQTAPPTTDGAQTQQFLLFDLGETIAPPAPAEPPLQREATPPAATRSNKRSQRPAGKAGTQPTPAAPVRLEITSAPALPELPPLYLAAVRIALCLNLTASVAYLVGQVDEHALLIISIPPECIAAAAQLLLDPSVLNAAVCLITLEAPE